MEIRRIEFEHDTINISEVESSVRTMSDQSEDRPIVMIPGPIEFHEDVLKEMGRPTLSHVSPQFINTFGQCIERLREVFLTKDAQVFVMSGSGSLGWDMVATNMIEKGDKVLIANTGYFGDSAADCYETYGASVSQIVAPIGSCVDLGEFKQMLEEKPKLAHFVHVDTSTSVLSDIRTMAEIVRNVSPDTLICVDGVCSFGAEEFRFDEWGIDLAFTASQKALGVPPGLMVLLASQRAMKTHASRESPVPSYYTNFSQWIPIMNSYEERKPSYFATPAVNLISALNVSLANILSYGIEGVFRKHQHIGKQFRAAFEALGLEHMAPDCPANTISAVKYPDGLDAAKFLGNMVKNKVVIAGGLHKKVKATYFRIGHMGVSSLEHPERSDCNSTVNALQVSLLEGGHEFSSNAGVDAFNKA